jgi:hypothetical protein
MKEETKPATGATRSTPLLGLVMLLLGSCGGSNSGPPLTTIVANKALSIYAGNCIIANSDMPYMTPDNTTLAYSVINTQGDTLRAGLDPGYCIPSPGFDVAPTGPSTGNLSASGVVMAGTWFLAIACDNPSAPCQPTVESFTSDK